MATLAIYDINAYATQISKEFYIDETDKETDKSYVLMDEMNLFASDLKSRVKFISYTKSKRAIKSLF